MTRPGGGRIAPLLLCALWFLACGGESDAPEPSESDEPLETQASVLAGSMESAETVEVPDAVALTGEQAALGGFLAPENQKRILLFFPSASGSQAIPEQRIIFLTDTLTSQAKQAVAELLVGPLTQGLLAPFPSGTTLEGIFLPGTGVAVIDFGGEILSLAGGSEWEQAALYSLVNTVVHNFAEIHKVQILVQGQEIATLAGHLDTSRPLRAEMSRVDWQYQRLLDEDGEFLSYEIGPTLPEDWVRPEPLPGTGALPAWAPDVPLYELQSGGPDDEEPPLLEDEPMLRGAQRS